MNEHHHHAALSRWAGSGKASSLPQARTPDWSAVDRLIVAAEPELRERAKRLRKLLEQSAGQLKFSDPLLCDFGTHRWLDRETSYSDWLAWVLERLASPVAVLDLLGVRNPKFALLCTGDYFVQREVPLRKGLAGFKGQIDVLIRFGEPPRALIGIEVKSNDKQYMKQKGYRASLLGLCSEVECVLLANCEPPRNELYGFKPRRWMDLAVALRRAVAGCAQKRDVQAAMMLGFVAAVEQNLVGFGSAAPHRAIRGKAAFASQDLLEYLERAIEESE